MGLPYNNMSTEERERRQAVINSCGLDEITSLLSLICYKLGLEKEFDAIHEHFNQRRTALLLEALKEMEGQNGESETTE